MVISIVFQFIQLNNVSYAYANDENENNALDKRNKSINNNLYYSFPYLEDEKCNIGSFKKEYEKALSENKNISIGQYKNVLSNSKKDYLYNSENDTNIENKLSAIGGKVWHDKNGDGVQQDDEELIKGAKVYLLDENKKEIESTETDIFGRYVFKNLNEGSYYVKIEKNNEYNLITKYKSSDDPNIDNDFKESGLTNVINISNGTKNYNIDAGLFKPVTISSYVWNDINWNGINDQGESKIKGIIVQLYKDGVLVDTTKTDENGYYSFENLTPGKYKLKFVDTKVVYVPTIKNEKNTEDNVDDNLETKEYYLLSGENKGNLNIPLHKAKITSKVWEDKNFNGIKDESESGIGDVYVELFTIDGTLIKTTKTDNQGIYTFNDLNPGEYFIKVVRPNKYNHFSPMRGEDSIEGNCVGSNGESNLINVQKGQLVSNLNVGMSFNGEITTTVWEDKNYDGNRDPNEEAIQGIKVRLLNENGDIAKDIFGNNVPDQLTGDYGQVHFKNLDSGTYKVSVIMPKEYSNFTKQNTDLNKDYSNVNTSGFSENILLSTDKSKRDINAGLVKTGAIESRVWNDKNKDGKQGGNEEGVANVNVFLCDNDGKLLSLTKTDNNGNYKFNNLEPGEYYTVFEVPDNYSVPNKKEGTIKNHRSTNINLKSGEIDNSINLGLQKNNVDEVSVENLPDTSKHINKYVFWGMIILSLGCVICLSTRYKKSY